LEDLAALAANWPTSRLIGVWNSIPGNTPVKKFTDRKSALTRIDAPHGVQKKDQKFPRRYELETPLGELIQRIPASLRGSRW